MITVYRHDEPSWERTVAIEFPRKASRTWGLCVFTVTKWKLEEWCVHVVIGGRKRLCLGWEGKR